MAKLPSKKSSNPTENNIPVPRISRFEFFVLEMAGRVGVSSTVVLTLMIWFITAGSEEQHKQFFNKFILLKFEGSESKYLYFIIVCLVVVLLAQSLYHRSKVRLKDKRIKELESDRDKLQNKLLK